MLAKRLDHIGVSATLAISAQAKAMKAAGLDVIDFSIGEPDFPTPGHAKDAAKHAIDSNFTHYTAAAGIAELRRAIADKFARDNGLTYETDEILVSQGAKHSLFNACMALLDPGDEAIIPVPYWLSYPQMVRLAGGEPVFVEAREEDDFLLTPEALSAAVTSRTKVLFLNNPSNPTGMAYDRERLEAIAAIVVEHGIIVFADEIYEKLLYDKPFVCFASLAPAVRDLTMTVNGLSKAYAMTGWRLGYAAGRREIIQAMTSIQSQSTSSLCSVSQRAGVAALNGPQDVVDEMVATFRDRRELTVGRLREMPGLECLEPDGAFYAFPNITALLDRIPGEDADGTPTARLVKYLLDEAEIALVPGSAFGSERNIRLSYACSAEDIARGLDRMAAALAKL